MKKFDQYQINSTIYTGDKFVIYHAEDIKSKKSAYLKALRAELPDLKDAARLQREYTLLSQLDAPEIIKCFGIVKEGHQIAMVMEDIIDGVSLQEYCKPKACEISDFLNIAIQIVQGLIALHEKKIIHKDIKPSNILISKKSRTIKIIDFGISTQLSRENPEIASNNIMEGSLPYISPEQTGMVNTPLDYRTDFYSLGITFYEMLTQQYPLKGANYKEWTAAHVSVSPKPLRELNPNIPKILSDIIMRLIEKIPKNRYQNFSSLKKDLEECQRQFLKNKHIEDFTISTGDLTDHFQVSDKLYGRDTEIQKLQKIFKATAEGERTLLLISGYSGAGKSSLVNEIKESVVAKKAYYTIGKVDQYNQSIPYGAFVEAFKDIIKYLFQESDTIYTKIVEELKQKLYPNEQMLINLIPSLKKILGDSDTENLFALKPYELKLSTTEDENRFKLVIKNFIKVISKKEHPLVIFLDDLQWAGSATFNLLQNIILDTDIESLLIIGAYRDNEVKETHPLSFMINDINKIKPIEKIELLPLKEESVAQIVSDTLHCTSKSAKPLTEVIYKKTEGNPFFTSELLKNLHRERYIDFNYDEGRWEWDIEKIKSVDISDNVVEFMISRLKQLPESTRELLKKAACIGSQFDLQLLAYVAKREKASIAEDLLISLKSGILIPLLSDYELAGFYDEKTSQGQLKFHAAYRFQHDRIQQAAYEMIDPLEKPIIHLLIGKTLQETYDNQDPGSKIVSIADHMNKAQSLITNEKDRIGLAKINLLAGIKAKESIAYQTAYDFLKIGVSFLPPKSWSDDYQLTCELYEHFSQSAFLCGELSDAHQSNETLLLHAVKPLEKAEIYRMRAMQHIINGKSDEALDDCIEGLKLLGIKLKKNVTTLSVVTELMMTKFRQGLKAIAHLIDLPQMQNAEKIIAMQLLAEMIAPCYTLGNSNLFAKAILRQVNLSIHYGHTKESPHAYASYGTLLNAAFNQPEAGFKFGELAVRLNEELRDTTLRCRTLFVFYAFIFPWNKPIHDLYTIYDNLVNLGYQSGDLLYMTYTIHLCLILQPKDTIRNFIALGKKYLEMVRPTKYEDSVNFVSAMLQFKLSLENRENSEYFKINSKSEEDFLKKIKASRFDSTVTVYLVKKLIDCYLFEDYLKAYEMLDEVEKSLGAMLSSVITEEYYVFATLVLARQFVVEKPSQQKKLLNRMQSYYKKIKNWASHCEVNFLQHALLLEATLLRLKSKNKKAAMLYEQAVAAAQKNDFLHDEALICEEAAYFYHGIIDLLNEQKYLKQAHYAYLKWGALAKVALLEQNHPELKMPKESPPNTGKKSNEDTITL